ncbi:hypothetical protein AVEN_191473-1 [Araneus ventricosus]|uniref:Uncharacterized protein n=1 Tax=Araneus ventricosus TaxID=182803 RepID=A0A4Y2T644_ARAVE|nr:hypothetical protein AVEN_191473-1 [Araneus ventricosus]
MLPLDRRQLEKVKGELLKLKKKEAADCQVWHNVARTEERKKQKNKEIADCQTWHNVGRREEPRKQKNKEIDDWQYGIKTLSSLPISVITVAFMTFGPRCAICNPVPLRSLGISRLRISSTGIPTFNLGLSESALDNSKMLKSSTEYDVPC